MIDPSQNDPGHYITFREEIAVARNRSRKGKITIETVGLNRSDLKERRREHLLMLVNFRRVLREPIDRTNDKHLSEPAKNAEKKRLRIEMEIMIDQSQRVTAEFSAMVRVALS